MGNKKASI